MAGPLRVVPYKARRPSSDSTATHVEDRIGSERTRVRFPAPPQRGLSRYFGCPGVEEPAALGRLPEGAGPMRVVTRVTSDCRGLLCAVSGSAMGSTSLSTPRTAVTGSREQVGWGVEKSRREALWRGSPGATPPQLALCRVMNREPALRVGAAAGHSRERKCAGGPGNRVANRPTSSHLLVFDLLAGS